MSPKQFKEIREKLGLTQAELADLLGMSGKMPISHYETGFRTPGVLVAAVMMHLDSLPERKATAFIEEFQRHVERAQKSTQSRSRG